jgi:hypothetical protein
MAQKLTDSMDQDPEHWLKPGFLIIHEWILHTVLYTGILLNKKEEKKSQNTRRSDTLNRMGVFMAGNWPE